MGLRWRSIDPEKSMLYSPSSKGPERGVSKELDRARVKLWIVDIDNREGPSRRRGGEEIGSDDSLEFATLKKTPPGLDIPIRDPPGCPFVQMRKSDPAPLRSLRAGRERDRVESERCEGLPSLLEF